MNRSAEPNVKTAGANKRRAWVVVKWGVCFLVVAFVARRAWGLWNQDQFASVDVNGGWLALSLLVYLAGWIPSVWFWQQLMHALDQRVRFPDCVRAYYCGHLGKYVPGKALVLVIRSGIMKSRGFSAAVAAVTATFETLLFMAAGAAIGLALFPITRWPPVLSEWISSPWLMPVIVAALTAVALPLIAKLATRLAVWMTPRKMTSGDHPLHIGAKLVACGLAVFVVSWALLGLSLGLTLRAVSDQPLRLAHWPVWTGAVALATSAGFAAILIPGGIGVREGLLIEILRSQPEIGVRQAVVASVLLRLIWLIAEILAAVVLYYGLRKSARRERQ